MNLKLSNKELEFLEHSNFIEGVWDSKSLDDAVIAWTYLKGQKTLTDWVVCRTHQLLMRHQDLPEDEKGKYRCHNVGVYHKGKLQKCPDWQIVPSLMWKWLFEGSRVKPPIDAIRLHIDYEQIHPFADGNGRTGRMFLNWQRIKILNKPILVIREEDKEEYYSWFNKESYLS